MARKHAASSDGAATTPPASSGGATMDAACWQKLLAFLAREDTTPEKAYRSVRERLLKFFVWRGSHNVDELADETLTRVAGKLAHGDVQAEHPCAFVLGVARLVDLEWKRREGRWVSFNDAGVGAEPAAPDDTKERLLAALELCLQELSAPERSLMLRYHEPRGERRSAVRQAIADELATALNALRVRMHRMRLQVEACVARRLAAGSVSA